jgi:hypothetical protein
MHTKGICKEQELAIDQKGDLLLTWINDTISLFEKEVKTNRAIDHLCITSLSVSLTYSMAITSLLKIGVRMPTKALLRMIFELSAKLVWCFVRPDGENDPNNDIISERIERWAKSSLRQNIKIIKATIDCLGENDSAEAKKHLAQSETLIISMQRKEMPNFNQLLGQLSDIWSKRLYVQCYLNFNNAVHLNVSSLCEKVKEGPGRAPVLCDDSDDVEELMQYCMSLEHIILWLIRHHYGWETEDMDKDFKP